MWVNMDLLVWEAEGDWAAGEHDQRERSPGRMEPVGTAGDEPHLVVERLDSGVVDPSRTAARMPSRWVRIVPASLTSGCRRLRLALAHQRSSSSAASVALRSPTKTSRRLSLSP